MFVLLSPSGFAKKLKVQIHGMHGPAQENIKNRIDISLKSFKPPYTHENVKQFQHKMLAEVNKAIPPYGYFRATISSTIEKKDKNWIIHFNIDHGPPIIIKHINIDIEGSSLGIFKDFIKNYPLKVGDVLETPTYDEWKKQLLTLSNAHGFLDSKLLKHEILVNRNTLSADINMHLTLGDRYLFGDISFSDTPFANSFLERFLNFKTGEYYSTSQLEKTQDDLINSQYFAGVNIISQYDNKDGLFVPVNVQLLPKRSQAYTIGAGFSTDSGFEAILGAEFRRLNSRGHRLKATLQASLNESGGYAAYIIPGRDPTTDEYSLSVTALRYRSDAGLSNIGRISLSSVRSLSQYWQRTYALILHHEKQKKPLDVTKTFNQLMPSVTLLRRRADNYVYPSRGSLLSITLQGGVKGVVSKSHFLQLITHAKIIRTLGTRSRFTFKTEAGSTLIDNLNNISLSTQFFMGGVKSIRGYGHRAIGTGRNYVIGSIDYQFRLIKNWGLTVFYDVGFMTIRTPPPESSTPFASPNRKRSSIGTGIFVSTPIGPITIGVATPLEQAATERFRLVLSMGPDL